LALSWFSLTGAEFPIRSGELHSTRIPREHWAHRLRMAKALGLTTVSTYVFWSRHEPEPGKFDWSGENDLAEFCRQAQREGLQVLLRPGPYVCGEYDLGGLPWWLLKDREMRVRSRYPGFLSAVQRYYKALGEQLAPLQATKGGPIVMVQVEDEYDGHGSDDGYIEALAAALRDAGFDVPLYTSEMTWSLRPAKVPGLIRGVGFGSDPDRHFADLRQVQPDGPMFCSEFYTGWYDVWGHQDRRIWASRV
jgi:beta-galactosidase